MSRIGKLPIELPTGVQLTVDGPVVKVVGPKGSLMRPVGQGVSVSTQAGSVRVEKTGSGRQADANFGTSRAIIQTMVTGVSTGWKRALELSGVGFTAKLANDELVLSCGFSHEVRLPVPAGVTCVVGKTSIECESSDKELVGRFASTIRAVQPPEPYLGKGIKYSNEVVRRKAGKTGKK